MPETFACKLCRHPAAVGSAYCYLHTKTTTGITDRAEWDMTARDTKQFLSWFKWITGAKR